MSGAGSTHDVIVLGLGGMGSSAAYHLARRGASVLGLDQHPPAHALGSSHGASRVYRQCYFEDPAYVPLLLRAHELWERLNTDAEALGSAAGWDGPAYVETGGVWAGPEHGATFGGSLLAAQRWRLPHEVLEPAEVAARYPTMRLGEGELALVERRAGYARPERTVAAHLALAAAAGAELHHGEKVLDWSQTADGVRVVTTAGVHTAGRLVVAPGAWAPDVLADLGVPMVVERQVMHWLTPSGSSGGEVPFTDHPVFISGDGADQVYGFPAIDGPGGGVKISYFRAGRPTTAEAVDREVTDAERAEIVARARRTFPALTAHHDAATCLYTTTPDEHFVIAPHPGHDRVVVACGFSGHGFKFVPVVGEILAELTLDGATDHPIDLFDPRRPALSGVPVLADPHAPAPPAPVLSPASSEPS